MFLVAIVDVEVLDARVQQLQLGALALEVRPATMPALDFALTLRTWMKASSSPSESLTLCNLSGGT